MQNIYLANSRHTLRVFLTIIVCSILSIPAIGYSATKQQPQKTGVAWVYHTQGEYNNVRQDLVDAIESYGMVVSYTAHAAAMFERTAGAVGAIKKVYDFADILLFCKANTGYQLTLADPHNLVLCPYAIAVYSLRDDKDTIYVSFRRPELNAPEYASVLQLLEDIVSEVVN